MKRIATIGVTLIVGIVLFGVFGPPIYQKVTADDAAAEARQSAVITKASQTETATHGLVSHIEIVRAPGRMGTWDQGTKRIYVQLALGTCLPGEVQGYFESPAHPKGPQDLSSLYIVVPNASKNGPTSIVAVDDSRFGAVVSDSALAQCVAGDSRLWPNH